MPLETTTTRLQQITAKSGNSAQGPWTRYDFQLDGFKRAFSTFNRDLVDMTMQGKMVQVSYTEKPASFTNEAGQTVNYTQYNLENIQAVEGDTGTLDDVLAPVAQQQAVQTVVSRTNGETPSSPSDAAGRVEYMNGGNGREDGIRRSVAVQEATKVYVAMLEAGLTPDNATFKNIARLVYATHGELGD